MREGGGREREREGECVCVGGGGGGGWIKKGRYKKEAHVRGKVEMQRKVGMKKDIWGKEAE